MIAYSYSSCLFFSFLASSSFYCFSSSFFWCMAINPEFSSGRSSASSCCCSCSGAASAGCWSDWDAGVGASFLVSSFFLAGFSTFFVSTAAFFGASFVSFFFSGSSLFLPPLSLSSFFLVSFLITVGASYFLFSFSRCLSFLSDCLALASLSSFLRS